MSGIVYTIGHGHWPAATPHFLWVSLVGNVVKRHLNTSSHLASAHCQPEIVQLLADLNVIDPSTLNKLLLNRCRHDSIN